MSREVIRRSLADKVMASVAYIERHLAEPISLADIANAGNLSPRHLQRSFHQLTGDRIVHYTRRRRLTESTRLFHHYDRLIDVALAAGFDSPEVYSRAFKQVYGQTPRQFRHSAGELHPLHGMSLTERRLDLLQGAAFRSPKIMHFPFIGFQGPGLQVPEFGLQIDLTPQVLADYRRQHGFGMHPEFAWEAYCMGPQMEGGVVNYFCGKPDFTGNAPAQAQGLGQRYHNQWFARFTLGVDFSDLFDVINLLHTNWLAHSHHHIGLGPALLRYTEHELYYYMSINGP
ncbi:helix-turn-helix domain-containing protein [Corallincola platygyrae]|uniref:Helix-turn-helix domain-containing protein n=1 Tax=Corallincola platygyrae TaxID=1193278 RepID=A0ABW4XP77_9GAMM